MRIPRDTANSFLKSSFQGIACECCIYRCSARELMQYCGSSTPNKDGEQRMRHRVARSSVTGETHVAMNRIHTLFSYAYEALFHKEVSHSDTSHFIESLEANKLQFIEEQAKETNQKSVYPAHPAAAMDTISITERSRNDESINKSKYSESFK